MRRRPQTRRVRGIASLMTGELMTTLVEHAGGNYRVLMNLGSDLLAAAAQHDAECLDEKLFFEVFASLAPNDEAGKPTQSRRLPSGCAPVAVTTGSAPR